MHASFRRLAVLALVAFAGRGTWFEGGREPLPGEVTITRAPHPASRRQGPASRPFHVGETLTYDAKVNFLHVGTGVMTVRGIDTVRGRPAYHTEFNVRGRMLFFVVDDHFDSWFDTETLSSLRYVQRIHEGSYRKERRFDFYPERRMLKDAAEPDEEPSVAEPLDEGSFVYFIRTIPLEVGRSYEFDRYFRPDMNPVRIDVLRHDRVSVPAGKFDATVIRPIIKTGGLFSEGGRAEIWLADDSTHEVLKMTSGLPFGTLILELKDR